MRPGAAVVDRVAQHLAGVGEVVGLVALDVALGASGGAVDLGGGQLVGGGLGHPRDELVGLVDHRDVVLRDHRDALDRVDGEQRVVGDDQLGAVGALLGALGEALGAVGALAGAEALAVADADLPPDPVGVPRRVVALAGAAVLGLLLDPLAQRDHLGAQRALGQLDQRALVVGHALAHAVQAGVVGPPLEYGEGAAALELVAGRLEQGRDVALDELVLEGERRRGHHDPVAVQQRGHEVAQRLAGAGAGLDEQVALVLHRRGDRLGHRDLAGTLLTTELLDRSGQHLAHVDHAGHPMRTHRRSRHGPHRRAGATVRSGPAAPAPGPREPGRSRASGRRRCR